MNSEQQPANIETLLKLRVRYNRKIENYISFADATRILNDEIFKSHKTSKFFKSFIPVFLIKNLFSGYLSFGYRSPHNPCNEIIPFENIKKAYNDFCEHTQNDFLLMKLDSIIIKTVHGLPIEPLHNEHLDCKNIAKYGKFENLTHNHSFFTIDNNFQTISVGYNTNEMFIKDYCPLSFNNNPLIQHVFLYAHEKILVPALSDSKYDITAFPIPSSFLGISKNFVDFLGDSFLDSNFDSLFLLFLICHFDKEQKTFNSIRSVFKIDEIKLLEKLKLKLKRIFFFFEANLFIFLPELDSKINSITEKFIEFTTTPNFPFIFSDISEPYNSSNDNKSQTIINIITSILTINNYQSNNYQSNNYQSSTHDISSADETTIKTSKDQLYKQKIANIFHEWHCADTSNWTEEQKQTKCFVLIFCEHCNKTNKKKVVIEFCKKASISIDLSDKNAISKMYDKMIARTESLGNEKGLSGSLSKKHENKRKQKK